MYDYNDYPGEPMTSVEGVHAGDVPGQKHYARRTFEMELARAKLYTALVRKPIKAVKQGYLIKHESTNDKKYDFIITDYALAVFEKELTEGLPIKF